jgi:hypothetical protein
MNQNIAILVAISFSLSFANEIMKKEGSVILEENRINLQKTKNELEQDKYQSWKTEKIDFEWHKHWTNYEIISNSGLGYQNNPYSMLEEIFDQKWSTQKEGMNCSIVTTKLDYLNKGYNKQIWQLTTHGKSSKLYGDFYIVYTPGCCGEAGTRKYYNVNTGKYIKSFNLEAISAGSTSRLFFGYINISDADSTDKARDTNKYHGIGFLFSDTSVVSKIYIPKGSFDAMDYPEYSMEGNFLILRFIQGKTSIKLEIANNELRFPKQ